MLLWEYKVTDKWDFEDTLPTDGTMETVLDRDGMDGWELVSANWERVRTSGGQEDSYRVYRIIWKRQKGE